MQANPEKAAALRQLLAARFPTRQLRAGGSVPTGIASLDAALEGGLAAGRLTELVSAPSGGGQLVLARILGATRTRRLRMALVDGGDGFTPNGIPADHLRHLVWVRCRKLGEALAAADVLIRDANYGVVAVDLRGTNERELRKVAGPTWYRIQRAAEDSGVAVMIQTAAPVVPAVAWRMMLTARWDGAAAKYPRDVLAERLAVEPLRRRIGEAVG